MNFLAHLTLADRSAASVVGNILADFLRGSAVAAQPAEILRAIRFHQAVDRFTDGHVVVARAKGRISATRRRFGAVLIDIFFDHFLAQDFSGYYGISLAEFSAAVYQTVRENADLFPGASVVAMEAMIAEDWLTAYATPEGIDLTLQRMARRLSRPTALASGVEELYANYDLLRGDFREFFAELRGFAALEKANPAGV